MNDIQLKNRVETDFPDNGEGQITASTLRGFLIELINSKVSTDKNVKFQEVADNAEMNTTITSGGFNKGVLLVDSYTDTYGNTGVAIILVFGGAKYLIPTLAI